MAVGRGSSHADAVAAVDADVTHGLDRRRYGSRCLRPKGDPAMTTAPMAIAE